MASTPVTEPTVQSDANADQLKGKVKCVVVTPERAVFEGIGEMVILPMYDGELGVLPGRAPLIGRLGAGELRIKAAAGTTRFFVEPGFVQVRENVVTVLTARAQKATDVTAAVVEKATTDAEAMPYSNPIERVNKARARDRAQGMKKVAARNAGVSATPAH
jgi:F-type H+-transporting ATPase subunit epsilon